MAQIENSEIAGIDLDSDGYLRDWGIHGNNLVPPWAPIDPTAENNGDIDVPNPQQSILRRIPTNPQKN